MRSASPRLCNPGMPIVDARMGKLHKRAACHEAAGGLDSS